MSSVIANTIGASKSTHYTCVTWAQFFQSNAPVAFTRDGEGIRLHFVAPREYFSLFVLGCTQVSDLRTVSVGLYLLYVYL